MPIRTMQAPTTADLNTVLMTLDGKVIAAGARCTIVMSADGGFHWQAAELSDGDSYIDFLRLCQLGSGAILALSVSAIHKSTDGHSFYKLGGAPSPACDATVSADARTLFVTKCDYNSKSDQSSSAISSSEDGLNWTPVHFKDDFAMFGPIAALASGVILVGNHGECERFDGRAWQSLPYSTISGISALCVAGERVLAAREGRPASLCASSDGGLTWSEIWKSPYPISYIAAEGNQLCTVGGGAVSLSRDGGITWQSHEAVGPVRAATIVGDAAIVVGNQGLILRVPF